MTTTSTARMVRERRVEPPDEQVRLHAEEEVKRDYAAPNVRLQDNDRFEDVCDDNGERDLIALDSNGYEVGE